MDNRTKQSDPAHSVAGHPAYESLILGNISTAIVLLDHHKHILYTNLAAENLLQESLGHLKQRCFTELLVEDRTLDDALVTSQTYTRRQATLLLPGHETIRVDLTVTPVTDSATTQLLVELVPVDRYRRIERDATLKEQHDVTLQMVRGLAHEIKNPLGGIKGSAQLLAGKIATQLTHQTPGDPLSEYTDVIITETNRLTSLVDRLLGPNTMPEKKPTNIHVLLERISKLIELEAQDSPARLQLIRDYDPSIPEVEVDPQLVLQALLNIVRNAMQAVADTPRPRIKLLSRIERQLTLFGKRHKVALRIDIQDNGPGIPEQIQEHLFYPMISARDNGTGLGLSIAQSIIHQHQGLIKFENLHCGANCGANGGANGGACFTILLPLEQAG